MSPYLCFIVRLPELPSDTPQDNPLLAYDAYPNFALVSPDKAVTASAKLAINYDVKLGAHLSDIKGITKLSHLKGITTLSHLKTITTLSQFKSITKLNNL